MPPRDYQQPTTSPYGQGGLPWWAALLIALGVFVPSTMLLALPGTFAWSDPAIVAVAWLIVMIGVGGVVWPTVNSVLCKKYGWWPIPVLFAAQWIFAFCGYVLAG